MKVLEDCIVGKDKQAMDRWYKTHAGQEGVCWQSFWVEALAAFQSDKRDTSPKEQLCQSSYVIRIEMLLLCGIFATG